MSTDTKRAHDELAKHAKALRGSLPAAEQNELFELAVEAGCLAAFGDVEVDAAERRALVAAAFDLSGGNVVEWEADGVVDECIGRIEKEGIEARVAAVGKGLQRLGRVETGLLLGALVAQASGGIDDLEHGVLAAVGEAAGAPDETLAAIVKRIA